MTIIKTNSYHLLSTCVSGTGLHTLHINLMKDLYYPHFTRGKLRRGEAEEIHHGHAAYRGYGLGMNSSLPNFKSVYLSTYS